MPTEHPGGRARFSYNGGKREQSLTNGNGRPVDEYDRDFEQAIALLEHYSFDIAGSSARGFSTYWAEDLPTEWLRLAVLEALYQGRYKAVSVSQILALWERKQKPQPHFNDEFERLICDRLFAELDVPPTELEPTESSAELPDENPTGAVESVADSEPESAPQDPAPSRDRPTAIEQFVPEDDSPVYDKLRGLTSTATGDAPAD